MRPVAAAACRGYNQQEVDRIVEVLIETVGIENLNGKTVLVKPNILIDAHPSKAVTTHPTVIAAVCTFIRSRGGIVMIGDSPSIQRSGFTPERSKIAGLCRDMEVPWIDFTDGTAEITAVSPVVEKTFSIARAAADADLIVSISKLKTHQLMYMTGAVKNLFGLLPGLSKSPYHLRHPDRGRFADMLIDLNSALPPVLHLMDAVIAMEGSGPSNGTPIKTGALLASHDPYLLDLAAAAIMGEQPEQIPVLRRAHERGLLETLDPQALDYPLERAASFLREDYTLVPKQGRYGFLGFIGSHLRRLLPKKGHPEPAPFIRTDRCISCFACRDICPAEAITDKNPPESPKAHLVVDASLCIRCYCCHEVCPVNAVAVSTQ